MDKPSKPTRDVDMTEAAGQVEVEEVEVEEVAVEDVAVEDGVSEASAEAAIAALVDEEREREAEEAAVAEAAEAADREDPEPESELEPEPEPEPEPEAEPVPARAPAKSKASKPRAAKAPSRRLAVLGSPIGHSRSPELHRAAYSALGLDWSYEAVDVTEDALPGFIAGLGQEWRGLSLTMPLKKAVLPLLSETDRIA
ncbi:MAG: shikimate dehydrogenase, partial [Leifsonia sp.]